jgi:hypothetical protein
MDKLEREYELFRAQLAQAEDRARLRTLWQIRYGVAVRRLLGEVARLRGELADEIARQPARPHGEVFEGLRKELR